MNLKLLINTRRRLVVLALAALLAFSASYAPMLLDQTAGTNLTTAVFACTPPVGGC